MNKTLAEALSWLSEAGASEEFLTRVTDQRWAFTDDPTFSCGANDGCHWIRGEFPASTTSTLTRHMSSTGRVSVLAIGRAVKANSGLTTA